MRLPLVPLIIVALASALVPTWSALPDPPTETEMLAQVGQLPNPMISDLIEVVSDAE